MSWWGGSGISWTMCKSFAPRSRQITMPVSQHSVFCRLDALPAIQPTASKHWRPQRWSVGKAKCAGNWASLERERWLLFTGMWDVAGSCWRWTTAIRLPLKPEMKQLAASRMLTARFHDIQPSLLLFLHRLRSIAIYNHVCVHSIYH